MELVLVEHAEPARADGPVESADPGLGDDGRRQAAAVAARFAPESWDALYTAPQRRCRETAEAISRTLGIAPEVVDGLAGFDRSQLDLEENVQARNEELAPPEASAVRDRAVSTVEGIINDHPGGRVLLVSLSVVIDGFIGSFLSSSKPVFHPPAFTGVSHVMASRRGHREIFRLNDSTHLRLPWPASPTKELR